MEGKRRRAQELRSGLKIKIGIKFKSKWHVTSIPAGKKDWQDLEGRPDGRHSGQCQKYTAKQEEYTRAGTQN